MGTEQRELYCWDRGQWGRNSGYGVAETVANGDGTAGMVLLRPWPMGTEQREWYCWDRGQTGDGTAFMALLEKDGGM